MASGLCREVSEDGGRGGGGCCGLGRFSAGELVYEVATGRDFSPKGRYLTFPAVAVEGRARVHSAAAMGGGGVGTRASLGSGYAHKISLLFPRSQTLHPARTTGLVSR